MTLFPTDRSDRLELLMGDQLNTGQPAEPTKRGDKHRRIKGRGMSSGPALIEGELEELTWGWNLPVLELAYDTNDAGGSALRDDASVLEGHGYLPFDDSVQGAHLHYKRLLFTAGYSVLAGRRGIYAPSQRTVTFRSGPLEGETVNLQCAKCRAINSMRSTATTGACARCAWEYTFRFCPRCKSANQLDSAWPRGGRWRCAFCGTEFVRPLTGSAPAVPVATAAHWQIELAKRELLGRPDGVVNVGGFTVIGGTNVGIPAGAVCSLAAQERDIAITVEIGGPGTVHIPYERLTGIDLSGGASTSGLSFFGGGFGVKGAVEGMLAATALTALFSNTKVNTVLHLSWANGEAILHNGELVPEALRIKLSPLWTRYETARATSTLLPEPSTQELGTKVCPQCAEEVRAAAKICRFCRFEFPEDT